MEALRPHDKLLVLKVYSYKSTTFPPWMGMLKLLVEIDLNNCAMCQNIPQLWQPQDLRHWSNSAISSTFPKLKELKLEHMYGFKRWWEINERQEQLVFPQLEKLVILECPQLTALPTGYNILSQSALPGLKELQLYSLNNFERWQAGEGKHGKPPNFPNVAVDMGACRCRRGREGRATPVASPVAIVVTGSLAGRRCRRRLPSPSPVLSPIWICIWGFLWRERKWGKVERKGKVRERK
uniref:R13L1/DRL21-like LRR repeat region domain-containing protein n=1 Tax=Leersia perrieri TaxID=77586 RepID=A0A0D9V0U6_9ORYZ